MVQLTWMRVALFSAQEKQYLVFTLKTLPLGTSGVWVVTRMFTAFSRSMFSICSFTMHFVCFGPTVVFRGLM